jgi:hypothetical protein
MPLQKRIPFIDIGLLSQDKTDMIQALAFVGRPFRRSMQGQVIAAGTQIEILRIRPPFDLHTQEIDIEMFTGRQIRDIERDMT